VEQKWSGGKERALTAQAQREREREAEGVEEGGRMCTKVRFFADAHYPEWMFGE
jgi:hypothetical protein